LFTYRAEVRVGGENQVGRFYAAESAELWNAFLQKVMQNRRKQHDCDGDEFELQQSPQQNSFNYSEN